MPRRNFPEWIFSEFPVLANAMDFVKTEFCFQVFPAGVFPGLLGPVPSPSAASAGCRVAAMVGERPLWGRGPHLVS